MENSKVLIETLQTFLAKKCKDLKVITFIFTGICAFILIMAAMFPAKGKTGEIVSMYAIVGFVVAGTIAMTIYAKKEMKKYDPENCKLIAMLRNNNKDNYIVWIYPHETVTTQYGKEVGKRNALVMRSFDHEQYFIQLPASSHFVFMEMLQLTLTNVTYGYSDAKLDSYAEDPRNMIV